MKALWHTLAAAFMGGAFITLALAPTGSIDPYNPDWHKIGNTMLYGGLLGVGALWIPRPSIGRRKEDEVDRKRFIDGGPGTGPTALLILVALLSWGCASRGGGFTLGLHQEPRIESPRPDLDTAIAKLCMGETEIEVRSYLEDRVDPIVQGAPAARASVEETFARAWRGALSIYRADKTRCPCFAIDGKTCP